MNNLSGTSLSQCSRLEGRSPIVQPTTKEPPMPEEPHEAHRTVYKMNFPRQGKNNTPGGNTDTFLLGFKKNNSLCPEEWIAACEGKARLTHWGWGGRQSVTRSSCKPTAHPEQKTKVCSGEWETQPTGGNDSFISWVNI